MNCFACNSVKCITREIDRNPKLLLNNPLEIARLILEARSWD